VHELIQHLKNGHVQKKQVHTFVPLKRTHMHARTHAHTLTHTHTCTNKYAHARTHASRTNAKHLHVYHTSTPTHARTCTHMYTHYTLTLSLSLSLSHTHTHTHTQTDMLVHTSLPAKIVTYPFSCGREVSKTQALDVVGSMRLTHFC